MKIVSINSFSHTGGASIAALRILDAINLSSNHEAHLLSYYKDKPHDHVVSYTDSFLGEKARWLRFVYERLCFLPYEASKDIRFHFSIANSGVNLAEHPLVKDADVIHLHWFNKSYLSLDGLGKILELGKPVVWTLHDMWAFTGGCHYNYKSCNAYQSICKACPMIKHSQKEDLSTRIWKNKESVYKKGNLHFVTCSTWLSEELLSSSLLKNYPVTPIPNPINIEEFRPADKDETRKRLGLPLDKKLILFVAMNTSDERKGFAYLETALGETNLSNIELLVIGKAKEEVINRLPLKTNYLGLIKSKDKMIDIYNAADVYVSPTLQDNLPNTVMESLACGTPVVAFETGGVPEMVEDRKEGRIVEQRNSLELAKAIDWVLEKDERHKELSKNARLKVESQYSYDVISERYLDLFNTLLQQNKG